MLCSSRLVLSVAVLISLITVGASAALFRVEFSGSWVMDPARSSGMPPGMKQTMTVVQKDDKIDIDAIVTSEQGDVTVKATYIANGQETDYAPQLPGGATGKGKRTAKWSVDGKALEVSEIATIESADGNLEIKTTRRWTLSTDGKELTIEMKVEGAMGTQESKRIFVKK